MMEENGVEDISRLGGSGGTIQLALDALKEKKGSVDQVVDYCEASYLEPGANKREVWLRTEEYLKDALGSVVTDIEDMAINLLTFVNAQADAMEKVTSDVVVAKTRLNRTRDQSSATRLLALRKAAAETPARQKIVVLTGAERPTKCRPLPPRRRISLKEKLGGIYADEPPPLSLGSDATTLAGGTAAGLGDTNSQAETAETWGEHSPVSSRMGMSELPSPSAHGGTPRSSKAGGFSASPATSPRAAGGDRASKKEKERLEIAAAARKAVAPVVVPAMAPPPPARDSIVMNKRLSTKLARPAGRSRIFGWDFYRREASAAPPAELVFPGRGHGEETAPAAPAAGAKASASRGARGLPVVCRASPSAPTTVAVCGKGSFPSAATAATASFKGGTVGGPCSPPATSANFGRGIHVSRTAATAATAAGVWGGTSSSPAAASTAEGFFSPGTATAAASAAAAFFVPATTTATACSSARVSSAAASPPSATGATSFVSAAASAAAPAAAAGGASWTPPPSCAATAATAAATALTAAAAGPPVHATPHYMDYDTLVDMHLITRQSFGNRPLFGTRRGGKDSAFEWLTYKDFGKQVDQCRAALAGLGISRGDTVAIISNNREEWAVCAYATYSLGGVFVPMYEEQRPKDWRFILEDSGAKCLFVATKKIYHETFHFAGVHGNVRSVFCFDQPSGQSGSFEDLLQANVDEKVPAYIPDPKELATLIYTSGTTGKPKGVMLSHGNIISNIVGLRPILPEDLVSCHDRSLSFLPWAHCYGQTAELHALMAHGASMGISRDVSSLLDELAEVKPTLLYAVPQLFKRVCDAIHAKVAESSPTKQFLFKRALQAAHRRRMLVDAGKPVGYTLELQHRLLDKAVLSKIRDRFGGNLKVSFVGGAATSMEVLNFFENIDIKILEGYGLTETTPLVTVNTPEQKFRRLGSTGRCLDGVTVKIFMGAEEMPPGEEGEVCVSGPNVMQGYNNLPEASAEVFFDYDGQRYFRTGDLGRMEDDTYLRITGRIKEQYKLENGKYVVPGPIEAAMTSSTYISQALVFGDNRPFNVALVFPDWELVRSWAEGKAGAAPGASMEELASLEGVKNLIAGEIALSLEGFKKYEIPRTFELLEEGFTKENNMQTQKLSTKRHVVIKHYHDTLMHMYGDRMHQVQEEAA
eukprot:g5438.t1